MDRDAEVLNILCRVCLALEEIARHLYNINMLLKDEKNGT